MRYITEAIRPDDDGTGLTNRSERKKRQNRLNWRAQRRRREAQAVLLGPSKQPFNFMRRTLNVSSTSSPPSQPSHSSSSSKDSNETQIQNRKPRTSPSAIDLFSTTGPQEYAFPLSTDHLKLLVQYNLHRVCLSNMATLSIMSPHQLYHLPPITEHTPVDSIPSPVLRNNFIRNYGNYYADEFWHDAVGDLHEAYERPLYSESQLEQQKGKECKMGEEFGGLMCWGDSWLIESYELGEAHLKKWCKTLVGCEDLLRSTNRWREVRSEEHFATEGLCRGGEEVKIKYEVEEQRKWVWQ